MIEVIQQNAELIQLGANVVLAMFTVVLAIATLGYTRVSKKQVEAQSRPFLKPATHTQKSGGNCFIIENIGNGTAHNVEVDWEIENLEGSERSFHTPIIRPGERAHFNFPVYDDGEHLLNIDDLESRLDDLDIEGIMIVDIEFNDSLDNNWNPDKEKINIVDQLTKRRNKDIFYTEDMDNAIV